MPRRCVKCGDEHWGEHEFFCEICIINTPKTGTTPIKLIETTVRKS
jgi:hypothetical protein